MKSDIELKMRILEKFGIMSEPKSIEFCKEAYKFVYGDTTGTTGEGPADIVADPVAVDLGLPSGTKWADRNIGALNPEDTGLYFSWGNTVCHEAGKDYDFEDDYDNTPGSELKADIDLEHDAARVNLGEPWKMPTKEQFKELVDNCESEVATLKGYLGRCFTSKINGNSIFMPFAGYISGTSLNYRGSNGLYWSSSLRSQTYGYSLNFDCSNVLPASNDYRFLGFSVRAVQ